MAVLDLSTGSQVCLMLTILSRRNMKKWECFSMSVWALAQPAMQQEAHLMFQSEARFSAGPHFPSVPACKFQHRAKGLLSFAPCDLEVVLIPVAPLVSVFQRSTLNTHPTSKLHIFLKSDEKCYLNKQTNKKTSPTNP